MSNSNVIHVNALQHSFHLASNLLTKQLVFTERLLNHSIFLRKFLARQKEIGYICISFFIVLDCKVLNSQGRRETTLVVLYTLRRAVMREEINILEIL